MNPQSQSRPVLKKPKYCFVTHCKNVSSRTPGKNFFCVPKQNQVAWCKAVGFAGPPYPSSTLHICEDHLNVEEDLENYTYWKLMPNVAARLKTRVPAGILGAVENLPEHQLEPYQPATCDKSIVCAPQTMTKKIQVSVNTQDRATNTTKKRNVAFFIEEDKKSITADEISLFRPSAKGQSASEFSETETTETDSLVNVPRSYEGRNFFLQLVKRKLHAYLGLQKKLYWAIELFSKELKLEKLHIIITLFKIKNNETFAKIGDYFELSENSVRSIFNRCLVIMAAYLRQFVYWPEKNDIKRNLPLAFRVNKQHSNVTGIIDCFEIEIEKPLQPIFQALTWSEYKHCNTIKYLVSATPDGFINYISAGYGGRISDVSLVEESGFLDVVPANSTLLADRGFKHLEAKLRAKSVKLLRPPSVQKNIKNSKSEVIESKIIASLRIHIERVIRRIRLYKMLKPHSVVNNKMVQKLDLAVVVACGLINLTSPIIKSE